ncbi:hypothetical protein N5P37_011401 [Trichoderma harzianum]|nr:hypothetical protein N5P37_011401 [Trichoderma harzianum]PKK45511.1 hypothetical protein CI102_14328 [Trichoderma harzianum]
MNDYASDSATWDFNSWVPASACNLTTRDVHCEIDAFSAAAYYEEWNLEDIPQLVAASSHGGSSMNTNSPKNSSSGASDASESVHSCLAQAAAILVDIRNDSTSTDLTWAAANVDVKTIVGDVIFANRRATGQVSRIMECACLAADYQISVVVSLICFHMIDRYGKAVAAARATLGGSMLGKNHVIGSVQILLDELRRITPLIGKSTMRIGEPPGSAGAMGIPVSGFDQLQRDLEHHLFAVLGDAESFLHQASE